MGQNDSGHRHSHRFTGPFSGRVGKIDLSINQIGVLQWWGTKIQELLESLKLHEDATVGFNLMIFSCLRVDRKSIPKQAHRLRQLFVLG